MPNKRGAAKQKRKQQQPRSTAASKTLRTDIETQIRSIEEEEEEQDEDEEGEEARQDNVAETQGTIILASTTKSRASGEISNSADEEDDEESQTFTDAQEAPIDAQDEQPRRSLALSGTTARVSDARPQLDTKQILEALPRLFNKSKSVIKLLTNAPDGDLPALLEQISDEDLSADPRVMAFEEAFRTCCPGRWIEMEEVQPLLAQPHDNLDDVPVRERVDDLCFLANLAMLCLEVKKCASQDGFDMELLYDLDRHFATQFETGLKSTINLQTDVGKSSLTDETTKIAIELRTQRYMESIASLRGEPGFSYEKALADTFYEASSGSRARGNKKLKGWSTPGLQTGDIKGKFKAHLTKRIEDLQNLVSEHEAHDDEGFEILTNDLQSHFPPANFKWALLGWIKLRAEEAFMAFEERWDSDPSSLQEMLQSKLQVDMPGRHPLQQIAAPNTRQETHGPNQNKRRASSEQSEDWSAFGRPTKTNLPEAEKRKILKKRAKLDEITKGTSNRTAASGSAEVNVRPESSSREDAHDSFQRIGNSEGEESQPQQTEEQDGTSSPRLEQPERSVDGAHFQSLTTQVRREERSRASGQQGSAEDEPGSPAFQADTRVLRRQPHPVRQTTATGGNRKRRRENDAVEEISGSRDYSRDVDGANGDDSDQEPQRKRRASGRGGDARARQDRQLDSEHADGSVRDTVMANITRPRTKNLWTTEEDTILEEGISWNGGRYGCMPRIRNEFDRNKVLARAGRRDPDMTNRARILRFDKLV